MRIVAYCVSTVGKSSVVSAEYLLSFWESGILVHTRLHKDLGLSLRSCPADDTSHVTVAGRKSSACFYDPTAGGFLEA